MTGEANNETRRRVPIIGFSVIALLVGGAAVWITLAQNARSLRSAEIGLAFLCGRSDALNRPTPDIALCTEARRIANGEK